MVKLSQWIAAHGCALKERIMQGQTVYGDILFFINFSMDFLALYITSRVRKNRRGAARMLLAAALGAIWGVISVMYSGNAAINFVLLAAVAAIMCQIAFRGGVLDMLRDTIVYFTVSMLLGGAVTALCGFFDGCVERITVSGQSYRIEQGVPVALLCLLALISAAVTLISDRIASRFRRTRTVELELCGKKFTAMSDDGNLLCDPISGAPVIFLRDDAADAIFAPEICALLRSDNFVPPPDADMSLLARLRMIPLSTVDRRRLVCGWHPAYVRVGGRECDAVVCLSRTLALPPDTAALVPSSLL
ncbi:MAG: sigma-E processing peptidase SpoIIGA [Eubacteriales bacterium]